MTKQTNWNGKEVLLVEVPKIEEWGGCELRGRTGKNSLLSFYGTAEAIELPDGYWQIAFADPLRPTDEEAGEWVKYGSSKFWNDEVIGYKDYGTYEDGSIGDVFDASNCPFDKAIPSLHSRITSEGFEHPERVIMLIKK